MRNLSNIPGWRTKRHIVVFESDDWGSIRTSTLEAIMRLISQGIDFTSLDASRYSYNDTLASPEDLSSLFEVLDTVKDRYFNSAVFTAMSLVANPDFNAIRESGFKRYYYEPFTETLKKYPGREGSFELWKQGIHNRVFIPQFHGREHLNIMAWMNALINRHQETLEVFNEGMWGYVNKFYDGRRINYQEAFNIYEPSEIESLKIVIKEGLDLFEKIFGYRATHFIPPNGPFPNVLEKSLSENGIQFITQARIQNEAIGYGKTKKVYHYLGMRNKWDQIFLTRNCFFEPGSNTKADWVDACLSDISLAFRWLKPAVISTHRVNYIGSLNYSNRQNNLRQLLKLLKRIKHQWADIEFMTSDELGLLIKESL